MGQCGTTRQRKVTRIISGRSDRVVNLDGGIWPCHGSHGRTRRKNDVAPAGAIHPGTQSQVASGRCEGDCLDVHIASGIGCEVAIGRRDGCQGMGAIFHEVDIAYGAGAKTSVGGGNWRIQHHIASGYRGQVSPGGLDSLVHHYIVNGIQCQRRCGRSSGGLGPADRRIHGDITIAGAAGVGCSDGDIGASG